MVSSSGVAKARRVGRHRGLRAAIVGPVLQRRHRDRGEDGHAGVAAAAACPCCPRRRHEQPRADRPARHRRSWRGRHRRAAEDLARPPMPPAAGTATAAASTPGADRRTGRRPGRHLCRPPDRCRRGRRARLPCRPDPWRGRGGTALLAHALLKDLTEDVSGFMADSRSLMEGPIVSVCGAWACGIFRRLAHRGRAAGSGARRRSAIRRRPSPGFGHAGKPNSSANSLESRLRAGRRAPTHVTLKDCP